MVGTLINRLPACAWLTGITTTLRERPLPTPAVRASNCCFKQPKPIQQGNLSQLEGRFLLDLSAIGNSLRGGDGDRGIVPARGIGAAIAERLAAGGAAGAGGQALNSRGENRPMKPKFTRK